MAQTKVFFWYMSDAEHALFLDFLADEGLTDPFTYVQEEGRWCLFMNDQNAYWNDILGDFDMGDGIIDGGAQSYGMDYWTDSTIPHEMMP